MVFAATLLAVLTVLVKLDFLEMAFSVMTSMNVYNQTFVMTKQHVLIHMDRTFALATLVTQAMERLA